MWLLDSKLPADLHCMSPHPAGSNFSYPRSNVTNPGLLGLRTPQVLVAIRSRPDTACLTESWFWEPLSLSLLLFCRCWKLSALESYEPCPLTYVICLVDTSQLTAYMGLWVLLLAWAPMTPLRWPTTVSVSALLSWERSFRFPSLLSSHTYNSERPAPPYLNLPDCRSA